MRIRASLRKSLGRLAPTLGFLALALLGACDRGVPTLAVAPLSGPPGTVLTISGLDLAPDDPFEVWIGNERAPARLGLDGTLAAAVPLFLGEDDWPVPPAKPQVVEVRRGTAVLGRSDTGVALTDLPRAPGSTQKVQVALADITSAYETLFSRVPVTSEDQTPIREGVVSLLHGLVSEGEGSLQAVLEGTSPALAGAEVDTELVDAVLASSGALDYVEAFAEALGGVQSQALSSPGSNFCRGEGEEFDLACQMQIYVVLDDFSRAFVKPTAETYANTVGLASGLLAMGTVAVPAAAIVGAILGVADFVMEKVAPALFPSRLTQFELQMPETAIDVGETTASEIVVSAANTPPPISYLDVFEQVKTLAGLKNIEFGDRFDEVLKATAEFALDLYLKLVKTYAASHPGAHSWSTAGDLRIPTMTWGPVHVQSEDLVTLFSFDEAVVQSLEEELEWRGLELGEATVRVMPRGPGERSTVLRDHALCLGCVYSGGAFGNDMPDSTETVLVGEVELAATPHQGMAPSPVTLSWTGLVPGDEPLTCVLDVGDGSPPYTIEDCANTTSQVHTFRYTSALESAAGVYVAELRVVGPERTATAEVRVDWPFGASPSRGEPPLDVGYAWNVPSPADAGTVRCVLDPGDSTRTYTFDDCRSTTSASHRYATKGSYVATLTIADADTQDTKTVPVTAAEASACAGVMDVRAWRGTIRYGQSRDVASGSEHVTYQLAVDVSGDLTETYRNEGNVGFAAETLSGTVSLSSGDHSHHDGDHRVDVAFTGSSTPEPGSRMSLNVRPDCSYDFYTIGVVAGTQTFYGESREGTAGTNPVRGRFDGASLNITGSYDFPVYTSSSIEASVDKPVWYAESSPVTALMDGADLGTVRVTWSFTPAAVP